MAFTERDVTGYECRSCGRIELRGEGRCCGERMEAFERTTRVESPETEDIARTVFGMTPTQLDICHVLMAEDEATVNELAESVPKNRSTIYRHLDHLAELGFVTAREEAIPDGGQVNVYSSRPPAELRRKLTVGLAVWLDEAKAMTDELTEEKIEAMIQQGADPVDPRDGDGEAALADESVALTADDGSEAEERRESFLDRLLGQRPFS